MNNRGGVLGFGLLPIFALVAVAVVLVNFISYDNNVAKPMNADTTALKMVDFNEQYIISIAKVAAAEAAQTGLTKDSFAQAALKHDVHVDGQGNFFVLADERKFSLESEGGKYVLSMPSLFVLGQTDTLTIKRNFDLSMEFNAKGEFIRFINK
jgi:hypothetical protein